MMADDTDDTGARSTAVAPAAALGAAMAKLAAGVVPPQGKPMSALELAELRSLMATGAYRPGAAVGSAVPAVSPSADAPGRAPDGPPLPATDIAAIKTMMLVRPYVPHPMPGAEPAAAEASGRASTPAERDGRSADD